jgi:hypothetical protein
MFSRRLPTLNVPAIARNALVASAISFAPLAAGAQEVRPESDSGPIEHAISISAQVDLVFQQASGDPVRMLQNNFSAGAMGANATSEYVFGLLNDAALNGLNQALALGARTGRITVVATSCQVGMDGQAIRAVVPLGVFINTTEMNVGDDGQAHFRTRVKYIPDIAPAAEDKPFKLVPNF